MLKLFVVRPYDVQIIHDGRTHQTMPPDEKIHVRRMVLECSSRLLYGVRPVAYHHHALAIPRQRGIITSQATNYLSCKLLLILI
jgi:hypothetical protein